MIVATCNVSKHFIPREEQIKCYGLTQNVLFSFQNIVYKTASHVAPTISYLLLQEV